MATVKTAPAPHAPPGWETALLKQIGAPATQANLAFLQAWGANEGNNGPAGANGTYNPLNVSPGGSVANYSSAAEGIKATADTLNSGYYASVVSLLKSGKANAVQIAQAVTNSPWAGGHYSASSTTVTDPTTGIKHIVYVGGRLVNSVLEGRGAGQALPGANGQFTPAQIKAMQKSGVITGSISSSGKATGSATSGATQAKDAAVTVGTGAVDATKKAVTGEGSTLAKQYVLPTLVIIAGVGLVIIALVLIGADIGLEKLRESKTAKTTQRLIPKGTGRTQAKPRAKVSTASSRVSFEPEDVKQARQEKADRKERIHRAAHNNKDKVPY